jgi:hypothetical protein
MPYATQIALDGDAVVALHSVSRVCPISFNDPDRFGYPNALPGEIVDQIEVGREMTCIVRLTETQALHIARALEQGSQCLLRASRMTIAGYFQLECDESGWILVGDVTKIERS